MPLWFLRRNHAIFRWRDCNWFLPRHVKKTYYYKKPITIRWHSLGQVMPGRRFHQGVRLYCSYKSFASLTRKESKRKIESLCGLINIIRRAKLHIGSCALRASTNTSTLINSLYTGRVSDPMYVR